MADHPPCYVCARPADRLYRPAPRTDRKGQVSQPGYVMPICDRCGWVVTWPVGRAGR